MATKPRQYIKGSVTQGSNDAFIQGSITTGLAGVTGLCYRVRELVLEWAAPAQGTTSDQEVSFTRKSFAAIAALTEKANVFRARRSFSLTTSGAIYVERVTRYQFGDDDDSFLILEDPFYIGFDSAGTSASNVLSYSIGYDEAKINESERISALVAALQ